MFGPNNDRLAAPPATGTAGVPVAGCGQAWRTTRSIMDILSSETLPSGYIDDTTRQEKRQVGVGNGINGHLHP